jgi:hypothetical protein
VEVKAVACAGAAALAFGGSIRHFAEGGWIWGIISLAGSFGWTCWAITLYRRDQARRR